MATTVMFAFLGLLAVAQCMPAATTVNINQPEYQVSLNYYNDVDDAAEVTTTADALVAETAAKIVSSNEVEEPVAAAENEVASTEAPAGGAAEQSDHELKQQVTELANGAVRYAYQGQTQHDEQSSSRVSHSLVRNGPPAPPAPEKPYHEINLLPATQQGQVLAYHAGVAATNAISYQHQHLPPLPPLNPAHARLYREQIFTVNVAAPRYGYGYTVRGIERPSQE
ncbi:Hypothetical predicted protein [Cloeon dipterum]|uniref:DUF4794 domain-containing protein n=1 Tax=Cloeon dipterum TaxID=197152 RepID=A0A8S1DUQ7_9INSE|nr:Hypothetical predicted protein [Cloeon dipterum]